MFWESISSTPVTGVAISLMHLMVVRVAECDVKLSFGIHCVCGTAALSSRLYNAGALALMSKAIGDSATIMLKPLRAEVDVKAA